jgi:hypothetical protein
MNDAKIAAEDVLKFLGSGHTRKSALSAWQFAYRFLGTVPYQNFWYVAMTGDERLCLFQLISNTR